MKYLFNNASFLKVYFNTSKSILGLFQLVFKIYFLYLFNFNFSMSLYLKYSSKQHVVRFQFLIESDDLYLLIGVFNLFLFNNNSFGLSVYNFFCFLSVLAPPFFSLYQFLNSTHFFSLRIPFDCFSFFSEIGSKAIN